MIKCSKCDKDAQVVEADRPFCLIDFYHYTSLGQRLGARVKARLEKTCDTPVTVAARD